MITAMQQFRSFGLFVLFCWCSTTRASCYLPNGTDVNAHLSTEVYQPCNAGDTDSMCCALNRPYPDKCRSDGLCFSTFDLNVWRDSCTDRTWQSSSCVKLCSSGTGQYIEGDDLDLATTSATITPCGDGSYCCGNGTLATGCCNDKKGVFLLDGKTTRKNPSGTSSTTSKTSTSTTDTTSKTSAISSLTTSSTTSPFVGSVAPASLRSTPTASTSSTPTPKSSNKTGAIVGGVIGGVATLVIIIGAILFLMRWKTQRGKAPNDSSWGPQSYAVHEVPEDDGRRELDARQMLELDTGRSQHELQ